MLAKRDFDPDRVLLALGGVDLDRTFRSVPPVSEGDLEQFLERRHNDAVMAALDAQKARTWDELDDLATRGMYRAWEHAKQRIFEDLGQHRPPSSMAVAAARPDGGPGLARTASGTPRNQVAIRTSTATAPGAYPASPTSPRAAVSGPVPSAGQQLLEGTQAGGVQLFTKMNQYSSVVEALNDARLQSAKFDLLARLAETSKNLEPPAKQDSFLKLSWELLSQLLGPVDRERQLARSHDAQATAFSSPEAAAFRRRLATSARKFYEAQFLRIVEAKLDANRREAEVGSDPGYAPKARAYIKLMLSMRDRWVLPTLELVASAGKFQGTPLWAMVYYLLRMGQAREALAFAQSVRADFDRYEDRNLVNYLASWVNLLDNPDGVADRSTRDQIAAEYNQRIKIKNGQDVNGNQLGDPFKLAVYKILGRCELNRKMIPGPFVILGTEDYLWLQLVLLQELPDPADAFGESYTMRDMARQFLRYGPEYFNPQGSQGNQLMWFMVLLTCGEFERAAHYLYSIDTYQVEAVHFAIAMAYAGVLRVPDTPLTLDADLAPVLPPYRLAHFDFARLMHQYTRSFYRSDPGKALHYLFLICIYGRPAQGAGEAEQRRAAAYNALAHRYVRDLVLDTRDFLALLGSVRPDGTRAPGLLERYAPLLNLRTSAAFIESITKKAAERAERDGGRFNDAIQLYNLAEDYDTVMRLINRYLGETLAQRHFVVSGVGLDAGLEAFGRQSLGDAIGSAGTAPIEEALRIAAELTAYYDGNPTISARVSPEERETCAVLVALLQFMRDYEEAKLESALQNQIDLGILPLDVRSRASRADANPTPEEVSAIRRAADAVGNLHESIQRNMPTIILATMDCLYRLWKAVRQASYQDPARVRAAREYRMMADNVVMFAGQMQMRMSADVYSKINRLAVVYMT
ncbi:Nup93/Nic96-domain-containing protein [Hyaloraphidium curvatum]|nr:Nup93/Nic96-domain-containing protein [Hyaloraphidium curvatum]